ncbi:hypothetical protein [Leeuwenhoekiella palythoae]|uniref:Lipoprotein n=1 Tax=Leeuwenhoekiella palythoae TaxID=573501 RepID=A0A1M5WLA5_9FLAO|nr:hypothetical protein [Leeuwenhoekiella palythoae]RXG31420.1 hypothetical protein DSM01_561 [Leeuwenhoekiella palythoae]SHH88370.1 hypothetical protein SAMN04487999_1269 [Leeuwenhoekiella palythoae]
MKQIFFFILTLMLLGCNDSDKKLDKNLKEVFEKSKEEKKPRDKFPTYIKIDTFYTKPSHFNDLIVGNSKVSDSLSSACSCDNNVKNNSIKIQIKTAIPTKNKLNTLPKDHVDRYNKLKGLYTPSLNPLSFEGQLKYINFELKDSTVLKANVISRSTELEYNGKDFKKDTVNQYQIKISRFKYHNASRVYGEFKIIVQEGFGFNPNDTIIRGSFQCMNWKINEEESIKNYKF